jgi:hypothetical protein
VSSTIHASTPPVASKAGTTCSNVFASIASSDHADCPMKCSSDWWAADVLSGAMTDARGSTLLRSIGMIRAVQ